MSKSLSGRTKEKRRLLKKRVKFFLFLFVLGEKISSDVVTWPKEIFMSKNCSISSCTRLARARCHCCENDICLAHLNEHNDALNQQFLNLSDFIDNLKSYLQTQNLGKLAQIHREKFERWRDEAHKKIDEYFLDKSRQVDRFIADKIDEFEENLTVYQRQIKEMIQSQQTSGQEIRLLNESVDTLKREINDINENFLQVHIEPFEIERAFIEVKAVNQTGYGPLNISSVYKTISIPQGSIGLMATDQQSLLIHQAPNLCLIDQDLSIYKQIPWRHGLIYDMTWSSSLKSFLIITEKQVLQLDQMTMSLKSIEALGKKKWFSCSCSSEFLFMSTRVWKSSLTKVSLNSRKPFEQQWESNDVCQNEEYIDSIAYRRSILALAIRNKKKKSIRFDLTSCESLKVLYSVNLDIAWSPIEPVHCSPFINNDWLIADSETGQIIYVNDQGQIKAKVPYHTHPLSVTIFTPNRIAIATKTSIHFHHFNHKKTYTISLV